MAGLGSQFKGVVIHTSEGTEARASLDAQDHRQEAEMKAGTWLTSLESSEAATDAGLRQEQHPGTRIQMRKGECPSRHRGDSSSLSLFKLAPSLLHGYWLVWQSAVR